MKALARFALILLTAVVATTAFAQTPQNIYVVSNVGQPWGEATNEDALNNIVGAGNWTTWNYETLDPTALFSSNTTFIFLEGGDSSFVGFQNFMNANLNALSQWISNGGRLLLMSAPNDPLVGAQVYLPDGVILLADAFYGSAASSANVLDYLHPVFNTPNQVATSYTGDFISHGYFVGSVSSGNHNNDILGSNLGEIILAEDNIGSGLMVVGGFTTDNFWSPQPDAHQLLENIIYYTINANTDDRWDWWHHWGGDNGDTAPTASIMKKH